MAEHKTDSFHEVDQSLASFSKTLSHPARIAILKILAHHARCICGEIVEVMGFAQSTVSQHLRELKWAGLITGTIDGPRSGYCINWEGLESMGLKFNELVQGLQQIKSTSSGC